MDLNFKLKNPNHDVTPELPSKVVSDIDPFVKMIPGEKQSAPPRPRTGEITDPMSERTPLWFRHSSPSFRVYDIHERSRLPTSSRECDIDSINQAGDIHLWIDGASQALILTPQLDVYYPPSWEEDLRNPSHQPLILVFFYGGGLTRGSKSSSPSHLIYNNLGSFFASRGILTVIPDYRLVAPLAAQTITFPQGSEDVRDSIEWVVSNLSPDPTVQRCHIFVLGHSAGGLHITGFLLTSMFSSSPVKSALRGVALMGVPYDIQRSRPEFQAAARRYYGNPKNVKVHQPLGLLRSADEACIAALPPVRNIVAESEPRSVASSAGIFTGVFREKGGSITQHVLAGHDHTSPILALSSGSGEEWGGELEIWMRHLARTYVGRTD